MVELMMWVFDKLYDVLGFLDRYMVEYLIGLVKNFISVEFFV